MKKQQEYGKTLEELQLGIDVGQSPSVQDLQPAIPCDSTPAIPRSRLGELYLSQRSLLRGGGVNGYVNYHCFKLSVI